mgnify:CR=1 FL=1
MIDYLRGRVTRVAHDHVVVEVQGIGYRVFCANPGDFRGREQEETIVYIHHHVREDAVQLFGFATREEQSIFRLLIEVSGIGPRIALGAMSGTRPESLVSAILNEDVAYLTRLPGIGRKTAQRLLFELKDRLKDESWTGAFADGRAPVPAGGPADAGETGPTAAWREAKEALLALGFTEAEIASALPAAQAETGEDAGAEALTKAALKRLYRR